MEADTRNSELILEDEALRDGLQIEKRIFSLEEKLQIFQLLKNTGIKRVQVGSFVHPKIVPQMADTDELIRTLGKQKDTVVSALILNDKGLERALGCGVSHVSMSVSVSDTHSRKNAHRPAAEAMKRGARRLSWSGVASKSLPVEWTFTNRCRFGLKLTCHTRRPLSTLPRSTGTMSLSSRSTKSGAPRASTGGTGSGAAAGSSPDA